MSTAQILGYVGGVFAIIAGLVSLATATPLGAILMGLIGVAEEPFIQGTIVRVLGVIGIAGGAFAVYSASRMDGKGTLIGGVVGLLAPCILSVLAIAGGYLMLKEKK
ncbi:MAG: hypothetical protein F7B20_03410 [Aeropyrum sp.]|nr:hypothetical protein [Aeropyrum sp.]MCE4615613.1 hypothetical protein [Aeropyrum sp.]